MVMGLALLLVSQAMLNMMVAVGLFPVTGQPLPLISKGGTSTLINCAYIGIILSVSRYVEAKKQQEALENSLQMQTTSNEAIITPTGQVEDEYEELSQDA
jgi:cell division protein FtsW